MTLGSAATTDEIVAFLRSLRNDENIAGMGRFGIATDNALGISNPVMQKIARQVKKNPARALELWETGIREARMLALYTLDPKTLDAATARRLAGDFASWEIVDAAADLFVSARLEDLIPEFAADEREFVRRTAFSMIASAVHLKQEPDGLILGYLAQIEAHAEDERNFVRKAVNWALRNIGKRNRTCHGPALALAEKLATGADKTARWIGRDAVRELTSEKVLERLKD
ncbi:DNA alkylation repair protein [Ciceribacter azotifigens]|uniref:DNA alkylation repair protein n=1 Tax=Ciceribacter azotifigens TaxID=2069303 RepID=UPI003A8AE75B